MKKLLLIATSVASMTLMTSCGGSSEEKDNFVPALDTNTSCSINVVGGYNNFEALEKEFNRFNKYYKHVDLNYNKLDDYNNTIAKTLNNETATTNIFFSYTWMMNNPKYESVVSRMENLSDPELNIDLGCIRECLMNHDSQGNVVMVPVFSRSYGMLVNKKIFKKAKLNIPTTWSDLQSTCTKLVEKGYESPMMGFSLNSSSCLMYTIAYPQLVATLANNPEALQKANNLDPEAGEYTRTALQKVKDLVDSNAIDLSKCNEITENYEQVIFRFFEGDVPMMICAGDTASGTKKREKQSEPFTKNPFDYEFYPIPLSDEGGYFVDSPSVEFSVNKDCDNLEMTNEFMRFLVRDRELNKLASEKNLITPTKKMTFDSIYAPFGNIPSERTFSPEVLGIKDALTVQIRIASYKVGKGQMSIDDAVAAFGTFE